MRYICQGVHRDGNGKVIQAGTISVFLAGTNTPANIYTATAGGTAVHSITGSSTDGSFSFWVDDGDYSATQKFKVVLSKANYNSVTYDNIVIYPIAGTTTSSKVANYVITSDNEVVFCDGTFTVALPDGGLSYEEHVANVGTGVITVQVDDISTDSIEGSTKFILDGQYTSLNVKCDGNGLWVRF